MSSSKKLKREYTNDLTKRMCRYSLVPPCVDFVNRFSDASTPSLKTLRWSHARRATLRRGRPSSSGFMPASGFVCSVKMRGPGGTAATSCDECLFPKARILFGLPGEGYEHALSFLEEVNSHIFLWFRAKLFPRHPSPFPTLLRYCYVFFSCIIIHFKLLLKVFFLLDAI